MKFVLMTLLAMALSPWLSTTMAQTEKAVTVVLVGNDDGQGEGKAKFRLKIMGGPKDGRSENHVAIMVKGGHDRGWLGVSLTDVPRSLSKQLDLDDQGILISNVVEDSPADKAGLLADDIILEIDGRTVTPKNMGSLLKGSKPGDEIEIVVLREGRERVISAELGSRDEVAGGFNVEWKFDHEPITEMIEKIHVSGKMLSRDSGGHWVFKDLGDLDQLKNLPANIRMMLPKNISTSTQVFVVDGDQMIKTTVNRDGETLTVTREGDGPITVIRIDEDGIESEINYDNAKALEADDEEAFELFDRTSKHTVFQLNLDGLHDHLGDLHDHLQDLDFDFDFNFDVDSEVWAEQAEKFRAMAENLRTQAGGNFEDAHEAYGLAMEELHEKLGELQANGTFDLKNMPQFFRMGDKGAPHAFAFRSMGKPKHTFETLADGTIEVKIRKGDSELVQRFEDEDDLADRRPKLYDRYVDLMELDQQ